ncbi:MAG: lytic transglycosylase domain-containing protein [Chromatiaceae bacterium]
MKPLVCALTCVLVVGGQSAALPANVAVTDRIDGLEIPAPGKISRANKRKLKPMIDAIARRERVDPNLVNAVIAAESGYNPRAVSRAGAIGLMQVMPATAVDYGVASADALFDPKTNVSVGTRHLRRLLGKYRNIRHAVSAYNAGEGVLDRNGRMVKYPETQRYTLVVISNYWRNQGKKPLSLRQLGIAGSTIHIPSIVRNLDPGLHAAGPETKPMFVLEPKR